ncbi:MAG: sugar ABC transporter permease [Cellulosilyticum sp.]|uniref:Sugar ABC transporter permease n=1 Tax=Zhenhengia yiwuensis TaxID=2763666 RepID=A0A926EJ83_9FIRM|nr:ABC transporter permease subunit [Zhenhengia yiwuensis]MBC8579063.1 sugar ABC transporter permease [Zhenhengia yiwuensis]MBP3889030.1 sugar ABC transporter permease [Cellulosilyticum sp.]MDU6361482.1 ABC transporter permease subunit [Clostridiales bacterium]
MVKENVLDKNTTLALEKSNQLSFKQRLSKAKKRIMRHWQLYIILLIPVVLVAIFSYGPMYGLQIAFKDYIPSYGIEGSKWVGFKHFINFINSHQFSRLIGNTITISLYSLIAGFPIPIILALALNECTSTKFKKAVQMITYAPHFISTVVMVGIILLILSPSSGIINQFIQLFGGKPIDFMAKPEWFKSIYVWSGVWQGMGYSSIIYIAALAGIDPTLHEAAIVDGASRWQRIWHVNIPGILPTVTILLIMNFGSIMSVGYEKILLMQNSLNMAKSDVISTFVYRMGLESAQYSFSAAVGLFNAVINFILLAIVNMVAKKLGETSLW